MIVSLNVAVARPRNAHRRARVPRSCATSPALSKTRDALSLCAGRGQNAYAYAASRRPARKVSTLSSNAVACWLSWPDAARTSSASARDCSAAWLAPALLCETSLVPAAACCTLRAISRVAESCSSTAAAMVVAIALISRMVLLMPLIAVTQSPVADWIAATCPAISSVALAVWLASSLTSEATTANPLPASPARAASMVALSASRLVWPAMALISSTTSPIFWAASARRWIEALVDLARFTASPAALAAWPTWLPISVIELASSSAAAATVFTLGEGESEARALGGGLWRARRHGIRHGGHPGPGGIDRIEHVADRGLELAALGFHRGGPLEVGILDGDLVGGHALGLDAAQPQRLEAVGHHAELVAIAAACDRLVLLALPPGLAPPPPPR